MLRSPPATAIFRPPRPLTTAERVAPGQVEFRVIDTGIGIAQADQARVFEDFQTIDTSFQRQSSGTGLGLGIVRRLVETLNGEVGLESAPGAGSVFWIRLPMTECAPPEPDAAPPTLHDLQRKLDILAVEDNEINLMLLQERLELMGHSVQTARNGLQGVQAAGAHRFDLILMDISMPVMDGLEACRQIRAGQGASAGVPIVALSANVLPDLRSKIDEAGMSGFLGKPLQQNELLTLLSEVERAPTAAPVPTAAPGPTAPAPAPHSTVLERLRGRFEAEVSELMAWLNAPGTDHADIAARCHMVAGSAAAFDRLDLRDALVQIEHAAKTGAPSETLQAKIKAAQALWPVP